MWMRSLEQSSLQLACVFCNDVMETRSVHKANSKKNFNLCVCLFMIHIKVPWLTVALKLFTILNESFT